MNKDFFAKQRLVLGGSVVFLACLSLMNIAPAQASGEADFNTHCGVCHTIGQGRRVGPDLSGVHGRHSQAWLEKFVKSSQTVIKSGDPEAVALATKFNNMIMPDMALSETQIRDILSYVKSADSGAAAVAATGAASGGTPAAAQPVAEKVPEPVAAPPSEADIKLGEALFQGKQRLENGGPACNSCHHVRNDAVMGGGILAVELTTVFSRLGVPGLKAILGAAPFPVMQAAYKDRALSSREVGGLVAFLEYADSEEYNQLPRDYGMGLFLTGIGGAAVLFLLFGTLWRGRKVGPVNRAIYDRQVKSVSDTQ